MTSPTLPATPGVRARRRAALIDEAHRIALRHFARVGYEAMALKHVCDEAGISLRTLFRHFRGKDALLGYGIELREARIAQRLIECPREQPLLAAYRYAIEELLAGMIADPDGARLTQRLIQEVPGVRAQYIVPSPEHRTDAMDEAMARHLGRAGGDKRVRLLRCFLTTAVIQAMAQWSADPAKNDLRATVDDYLRLLAPVAAGLDAR